MLLCYNMLICNQVTLFSLIILVKLQLLDFKPASFEAKILFSKQKLCFRNKNFVTETKSFITETKLLPLKTKATSINA